MPDSPQESPHLDNSPRLLVLAYTIAARAKGFGNALARACVEPDGLARDVYIAALEYQRVKYKPEKRASLVTFLLQVLERDFKDLVRKGMRLDKRLVAVNATEDRDPDLPGHPRRGGNGC